MEEIDKYEMPVSVPMTEKEFAGLDPNKFKYTIFLVQVGNKIVYYKSSPNNIYKKEYFRWMTMSPISECKSHFQFYNQFERYVPQYEIKSVNKKLKSVVSQLLAHGIIFIKSKYVDKINTESPQFIRAKKYIDKNKITEVSMLIYDGDNEFRAEMRTGKIIINCRLANTEHKKIINQIFSKLFSTKLNSKNQLLIKLKKL